MRLIEEKSEIVHRRCRNVDGISVVFSNQANNGSENSRFHFPISSTKFKQPNTTLRQLFLLQTSDDCIFIHRKHFTLLPKRIITLVQWLAIREHVQGNLQSDNNCVSSTIQFSLGCYFYCLDLQWKELLIQKYDSFFNHYSTLPRLLGWLMIYGSPYNMV